MPSTASVAGRSDEAGSAKLTAAHHRPRVELREIVLRSTQNFPSRRRVPLAETPDDQWARFLADRESGLRRGILVSYSCLAVIVLWMVPTFWLQARDHKLFDPTIHNVHLVAISAILISSVLVSAVLVWTRRYRALFGVTAAMIATLMIYMETFLLTMVDSYRSMKHLAIRIDSMLPPGEKIAFYHEIRDSAMFYADREAVALRDPGTFAEYIATPGTLAVVDLNWEHQIEHLRPGYRVVDQYGNKVIVESVGAPDHIFE